MPTVPYSPIPQAGQMVATPKVSVNTPEAAFGGTIGQAITAAGHQFEHVGDEIFKRAVALQELRNETDAKNADAEYMKQSVSMLSDFKALQGQQASPEALEKHIQGLDDLRQKIRGGLSNDASRRMFDSPSLSFMGREAINAGIHAAGEQKKAANQASIGRVDLFKQDAAANPEDDIGFQRAINATKSETRSQADIGGWSEAQTADQTNKNLSSLWAHRIVGLSRTDPYRAQEMLDQHRKELHPNDSERVERTVETQVRNVGARNISHEENADLYELGDPKKPERTLQDRINGAREKAEKLRPDDPVFQDMVMERTRGEFNRHKAETRDFDERNLQTVAGALNGNNGGKVPTNIDELNALGPQVAQAYDALPETKKLQINKTLAKNAKGDVFETPDTIRRFQELKGMRDTDPQKFMELDAAVQDIPFSQRRTLGDMQLKLKQKVETDPRIGHALSILKPNLLEPIGLTHQKDEQGYNRFVGALQDALDIYQKESTKLPDYKKTMEIGQRLLQDQNLGWWNAKGLFSSSNKLYDLEVPEAALNAIKSDPTWKEKGIDINADTPENKAMIQRVYVGARYKELYGGKDTSSKDQSKK